MLSQDIDVSDQDASHIKTIERALKNRLFFAVRQRRDLEKLSCGGHVRADTKDTVTSFTTTELNVVIYILDKWKRNTDGMEQYRKAGLDELEEVYGGGETFIFHTVASLDELMNHVSARNVDDTESEEGEDDNIDAELEDDETIYSDVHETKD
jgi:hypothetical protein